MQRLVKRFPFAIGPPDGIAWLDLRNGDRNARAPFFRGNGSCEGVEGIRQREETVAERILRDMR